MDPSRVLEEVGSVKFVVSDKFPYVAMKLIGSGLDRSVKNGPARAALLGAVIARLDLELLNGVNGGQHHEVCAVQKIYGVRVVVNSIEEIVILGGPLAIRREGA